MRIKLTKIVSQDRLKNIRMLLPILISYNWRGEYSLDENLGHLARPVGGEKYTAEEVAEKIPKNILKIALENSLTYAESNPSSRFATKDIETLADLIDSFPWGMYNLDGEYGWSVWWGRVQ